MIKNILFDFDDTLIDKKAGIKNLVDDYIETNFPNQCLTGNLEEFKNALYSGNEKNSEFFQKLIENFKCDLEIDYKDFEHYYWEKSSNYFKLRDGAIDLILELKSNNYHVGIITDGHVDIQRKKLKVNRN